MLASAPAVNPAILDWEENASLDDMGRRDAGWKGFGVDINGEWLNPVALVTKKTLETTAPSSLPSAPVIRGSAPSMALTVRSGIGFNTMSVMEQAQELRLQGLQTATRSELDVASFDVLRKKALDQSDRALFAARKRGRETEPVQAVSEETTKAEETTRLTTPPAPTEEREGVALNPTVAKVQPTKEAPKPKSVLIDPSGQVEGKYAHDYQGRSFLRCPLHSNDRPSVLPSRVIHAFKGHQGGIQALAWLPPLGHLLFAADMVGTVRLWDVLAHRQQVACYNSHDKAITSLTVNATGTQFSTASYDGSVRVWDTEQAQCVRTLVCPDDGFCRVHKFNPQEGLSHLLLAGVDRKILLWDLRSGNIAREYDKHLGSVMSLTFFDERGTKFISTGEDKTIRTWDFNVPVQMQMFADPGMHAVPHIAAHPTEPSFALQSLDNTAVVMSLSNRNNSLKFDKSRLFTGHVVSGTACALAFSKDGRYLSSGDMKGEMHIWDFQTAERVKLFKAHGKQLVQHLWHPAEPSLLATSSWDGTIKLWN